MPDMVFRVLRYADSRNELMKLLKVHIMLIQQINN